MNKIVGLFLVLSIGLFAQQQKVELNYSIEINSDVWLDAIAGEPPQMAFWMMDSSSMQTQTIWVTQRSGKNIWRGKVSCPIALPFWNSQKNSRQQLDAVSAATPKTSLVRGSHNIALPEKGALFIEINVAGDYNHHFTYWDSEGQPDSEGNGQPAVIYTAKLNVKTSGDLTFTYWAHGSQHNPKGTPNKIDNGLDSALKLIKNIHVNIKSLQPNISPHK